MAAKSITSMAWALLASFCWALGSFQLSVVASEVSSPGDANLSATFILWASCGLCGVLLALYQKMTTGILTEINGRLNVAKSFGAGIFSSAGMLVLSLALASDPEAAGFTSSVMPLNGLFVCIVAWIFLSEKLTAKQMLGVAIAVSGPVVMSLADKSAASLIGVAGGACAALLLGMSNFMRRSVMLNGCKSPYDVQMLVWCAFAAASIVAFAVVMASGRGLRGLDSARHYGFALGAGFCQAGGSWSFQLALSGQVGPATAIGNTMGAGVLLLQIIFTHPPTPALKLLGMVLCFSGACILALAPKHTAAQRPAGLISDQA